MIYLHPASLSLRVYIFPMSPIPMMPIVKLAMEEVMVVASHVVLFGVVVLSNPGIMIARVNLWIAILVLAKVKFDR